MNRAAGDRRTEAGFQLLSRLRPEAGISADIRAKITRKVRRAREGAEPTGPSPRVRRRDSRESRARSPVCEYRFSRYPKMDFPTSIESDRIRAISAPFLLLHLDLDERLLIVIGRTASIVGQRNVALNYPRQDFALRSRKNKRLPLTRALLRAEEDLIVGHRRGMVT